VVASASVFVAAIWHKTMTISKAMLLIRCTAIDRVCTNDTTHNKHLTAAARAERFLNTNNSIWMKMVNKLISTSKETNISQRDLIHSNIFLEVFRGPNAVQCMCVQYNVCKYTFSQSECQLIVCKSCYSLLMASLNDDATSSATALLTDNTQKH